VAENQKQRWWQTLPGVLTAVAGIITAVTGLIVALNQVGVFGGNIGSVGNGKTDSNIGDSVKDNPPDYQVSKIKFRIKRGQWGTESKLAESKTSVRLRLLKKDESYVEFITDKGTKTNRLEVYDRELENDIGQTEETWLSWHPATLSSTSAIMRNHLLAVEIEWKPHWSLTIPKWSFRGLNVQTESPEGKPITLVFSEAPDDFVANESDWSLPQLRKFPLQ
jgi:hypothetical protein